MTLPHKARPRDDPEPEYYYRRTLTATELVPAVGAGVGLGLLAFYVARLYLQRTPLQPSPDAGGRVARARRARIADGDGRD